MSSASYELAEKFVIVPYPFADEERKNIEAEYSVLLDSGIPSREVADLILYALEVLLNAREQAKTPEREKKLTLQTSDMLGRLLIFEELMIKRTKRKR